MRTPGFGHIVMLASSHSPFDTRIFHKEAKSLVGSGYQVSIIVPHSGDLEQDRIKILSVSLPKKGYERLLYTPFKIFRRAMQQSKRSVFHVHDAELLLIAICLKISGRKVIYDAHEDTPKQMAYQHWLPKILRKPAAYYYYILEKVAGRLFDAIFVAEPVMLKYYPPHKTVLLRNFPLIDKFKELSHQYEARNNWLVYIGVLSKPRGLEEMAKASTLAKKVRTFDFVVGGKFSPPELQEDFLRKYAITYLSWLPLDELVSVLKKSKIGIIIPKPIERYNTNYPVKMFEYMAAGLPVIVSKYGVSSEFVKECHGGLLVDPLDPVDIAKAIDWLFDNPQEAERMGLRGREMILFKYNWELESEKLIVLYNKLYI